MNRIIWMAVTGMSLERQRAEESDCFQDWLRFKPLWMILAPKSQS